MNVTATVAIYSKSVRGLVQWSLRSLETLRPEVAPSLRSPRAFGSLNRVVTLDSASNYYIESIDSMIIVVSL